MLSISRLWEDMHYRGIDSFLFNKHSVRILYLPLVVCQRFPSERLSVSMSLSAKMRKGGLSQKLNQNHKLPVRGTERLHIILHMAKLR